MDLYSDQLRLNASFIGSLVDSFIDFNSPSSLLEIHSVFKRVVNIITTQGMISIVTQSTGRAASYIVINQEIDFLSFGLRIGDLVKIHKKSLIINNYFIVDMSYANVWNDITDCNFRWEKSKITCENIKILKSTIDRYAVPESAWNKEQMNKNLHERIEKLTDNSLVEAVKDLIGLGPGLTPTGDDVLLGFLAVVNTCDDYSLVRNVFKDEILLNLKYTSDISAYFLKMAAKNHYHEYVQQVLCSMVLGVPESVMISVKQLLKIGATSGTDIATGIYLGFSMR